MVSLIMANHAGAGMTIDQVLDITPFQEKDWETIKKGGTASITISSPSNREIAVGVACLLKNNQDDPFNILRELKPMLPDEFVSNFGLLPEMADLESFSNLTLGEYDRQEARLYRQFNGGFGLNLSKPEIRTFRSQSTDGEPTMQEFYSLLHKQLFERLSAYRQDGLAGMPPYVRENSNVADPAGELKRTLAEAHPLKQFFPEMYQLWTQYPAGEIKNGREHYFWSNVDLDSRPAIILSHRTDLDLGERQILAERFFYASRFINSGFALAATIPIQEGRLFFYIYRVWIDRWSGFAFVKLKRSAGQRLMIQQMEKHLNELGICGSK